MAAAVIAALKARRRRGAFQDGDAELPHLIDTDNDGKVSVKELEVALGKVYIRADLLQQRLTLEQDLLTVMLKLPMFLICLGCFLLALLEFSPPSQIHNVHRHLKKHFGLDGVRSVADMEGVYSYMEKFEHSNEELQATSAKYWCESRYARYEWDDAHNVPAWSCASPRQYALTLSTDEAWKWSNINAPPHDEGTACEDDDAGLQGRLGNSTITCGSYSHVCDLELGLEFCRGTCRYCGPFTYDPKVRFDKRQVTMLPVIVYQTKYQAADCHGFAATYDKQPHSEVLWKMPALDGKRNGHTLQCLDRHQQMDDDYALELDCPAAISDTSLCTNNKVRITKRHTFQGASIYPVMLLEPLHDLAAMKKVEWLDVQTKSVALSTMVCTEDVEIFTSLTVEYSVDEAGNLDGTYTMISYRDLIQDAKVTFITSLCICICGSIVGLGFAASHVRRNPAGCKWGLEVYELFSRAALVIYPLALLVTWSMQVPMAEEFDRLLHAFLDASGDGGAEAALAAYFEAKGHVQGEVAWQSRHNIVAYLVLYVQFLQLIFYCSAHPKMAVLTATVHKALNGILHFLALFWVLFLMLAFMAHWMLGKYIQGFSTFGESVKSQGRMIFGEFIYLDGADDLHGSMIAMYWLYAFTFMLVVSFTLLNFFLAIIVEAFTDIASAREADVVSGSLWEDLPVTLWSGWRGRLGGWPRRAELIRFCRGLRAAPPRGAEAAAASAAAGLLGRLERLRAGEAAGEEEALEVRVTSQQLADAFPAEFSDPGRLSGFICYYFGLCPAILGGADSWVEEEEPAVPTAVDEGSGPRQVPAARDDGCRGDRGGAAAEAATPEATAGAGALELPGTCGD